MHFIRRNTLYWGLTLALIAPLASSCKQQEELIVTPNNTPTHTEPASMVRLSIQIPESFGFGTHQLRTRAEEGSVTESSNPIQTGTIEGNEDENKISHLAVFVFSGTRRVAYRYFSEESSTNATDWDTQFKKETSGNSNSYQVRFPVKPGRGYKIVVIANSGEHKDILDLSQLYHSAGSTSTPSSSTPTTDLVIDKWKTPTMLHNYIMNDKGGIPMVAMLDNKDVPKGGTRENPIKITPKLELKRVVAKLVLKLKNTNSNGEVFANATSSQFKKAEVSNLNVAYNLMEGTGGSYRGETLTEEITHTRGAVFAEGASNDQYKEALVVYCGELLSSSTSPIGKDESTVLKLYVDQAGQEVVYSVPVANDKEMKAGQSYDIRRNTTYIINATFVGTRLSYNILVKPWKKKQLSGTITGENLVPLPDEDRP